MRRSLALSEPQAVRAGDMGTWKFHFSTASPLPKGAKLKFDLQSRGRDIDWEIPTSDLSSPANVIYALLENGQTLQAKEVEVADAVVPQYEFTLPVALKIGSKITIVIGAPPKAKKGAVDVGNKSQLTIQRRRPFLLYIDPKGKGNYEEPEVFNMDIRGNKLHHIRILTPSFVSKNKRFDITVRFEDEFGNLTNNAPEDTLIELSYEHLRENLNWKLFVPETGFVILPNLYFNEAGVYKIQLRNLKTKEVFTSAPIKCFQENDRNLFWGLLHGESERVDSTENIENCLRHFRDEKHLNFFATSPFESAEETPNDIWKLISQNIADFNEEERFITFLGFQYVGETPKEGMRQILYLKDNKPLLRQKETKLPSLAKIYKTFSSKELISIPSFTMGNGKGFDFKEVFPENERVVEIYNAWGSSECSAKDGNPRPIRAEKNDGVKENSIGSIKEALNAGYRFGFVAGGLDDRGIYSGLFESTQIQYSPGLTAILAPKHTKEALFEALYNRSCYASTGARIIVGFYVAGHLMGSELSAKQKPGLKINRHISGYIAGENPIKSIEILRNGQVIHTIHPESYALDYSYDDTEPFNKVAIKAKNNPSPFIYYYLRVTQTDGHIAWSSPIWINEE